MKPIELTRTSRTPWIDFAKALCPPLLWRSLYQRFVVKDIPRHEQYRPFFSPWLDPEFLAHFHKIQHRTLVPKESCWTLFSMLEHSLNVEGDVMEAGVFQGGTARLLKALLEDGTRSLYLFDSFAGMESVSALADRHRAGDFADTSLAEVQSFVGSEPFVHYRQGWIPTTFAGLEDTQFCFAHIDLDLHQSIVDSCEFVYPRLSAGGVMVFDDYGYASCPGARVAVDEFFADKPEVPLALQTGQAIVHKL